MIVLPYPLPFLLLTSARWGQNPELSRRDSLLRGTGSVLGPTVNWLKTHILQIRASQPKVTLSPRGHLTMAGHILGCPNLGHGCYWHLAGRNQRSCHIFILQHISEPLGHRGNGNTLQYSCLENPMDKGVWQATVHGVTKSWT